MTTSLFVPGRPAPQGSKSFKGMRGGKPILVESSDYLAPWRETVAWHARAVSRGLTAGPITLTLTFVLPRPVATPKKRTPPAIKYPDVDKLSRAVLDALTGIAFANDSQVTDLRARKRLAALEGKTGVHIAWEPDLTELDDA